MFATESVEIKVLSVWVTDFDNDGILDIVLHNYYTKAPSAGNFPEIPSVGAQRLGLFRGFRTGSSSKGKYVFPEPVDETAVNTATQDITKNGTTGAQALALDVDGDGDLDLLWFKGSTPFYRENIGSSTTPNFGNVKQYITTAFDSIVPDRNQNIIADIADVNDDGRVDIVFMTTNDTHFELYVSYDQVLNGAPSFNDSVRLSAFSPVHNHDFSFNSDCSNPSQRYVDTLSQCDDSSTYALKNESNCHMMSDKRANLNSGSQCVNEFDADQIEKFVVKDQKAINCSTITYGCDVFDNVGMHMCDAIKFTVVNEGPTNQTEDPVVIDTSSYDLKLNVLDPISSCCACKNHPYVYSMRLTDINEDGKMDVTVWSTGSKLRIYKMVDWSTGDYNTSSGYNGTFSLDHVLQPVLTVNDGATTAQSKYLTSTTVKYCNMYKINSGGGLAWIDIVQTGHTDGKKDALLGSFNINNAYKNTASYPDACYGRPAADCNLAMQNNKQVPGVPPGGVGLMKMPLQLPTVCAVTAKAFDMNSGTLQAPYAVPYSPELHVTRISQIQNILLGGANPEDFVSPVVADWDGDGFDDIIMVGGRNMHRISYLETSSCSVTRKDVCSGAGLCSKAYDSKCRCVLGYNGTKCEYCATNNYLRKEETALKVCFSCPTDSNGNVCSNRGVCNDGLDGDGTCKCVEHFSGSNCEIGTCPPDGPEELSECTLDACKTYNTTNHVVNWPEAKGLALSHCVSCPPNTVLINDECKQCGAGEMINTTSGACLSCPGGKFQSTLAHVSQVCMDCRSGYYCLEGANSEILCSGAQICPPGSASPSSCCDVNSGPDATQASCQCNEGYFAVPLSFGGTDISSNYVPNWSGSANICENTTMSVAMPVCQECPPEVDCTVAGMRFDTLKIPMGYWQDPEYFTIGFVQSSDGTATTDGSSRRHLSSGTSSPMILDTLTLTSSFYVDQCASTTNPQFCLESSGNYSTWTACKGKMTGPLCGKCESGSSYYEPAYYRDMSGECSECQNATVTWVLFFIFVFVVLVVLGVMIFMWKECILLLEKCFIKSEKVKKRVSSHAIAMKEMGKKSFSKKNTSSTVAVAPVPRHTYLGKDIRNKILDQEAPELGTKLKILVTLFQIIMSFTTNFKLDWPKNFMKFVNAIATLLNFQIISIPFIGCLTEESYLSTFFLATIGPPLAIGLIILVQKLWIKSGRPVEKFSRDDVNRYMFYILFLIYPRTSQIVLSMFQCYDVADGTSYLRVDFTVECSDTYKGTIIPLAVIFTLIYPIGVPGLILYNLVKMKDSLYDPETGQATGLAEKKLGAMYSMYRSTHYYWEVIESYRKLFVCALLQFIDPESANQIIIAIIFSTMYSMYFSYNNPMRSQSDNLLYMFAELEIFAVSFCALLLKANLTTTENYDPDTFDGIMILTLLIPNILFFGYLTLQLYTTVFGGVLLGYEQTMRLYPVAANSVGYCSYISEGGEDICKNESERKMIEVRKVSPDLSDCIGALNMTYQRLVVSDSHMELSKAVSRESQICADIMASTGKRIHSKWLSDVCRAFNRVLIQVHDEGIMVRELKSLNKLLKAPPIQVEFVATDSESVEKDSRFGWRTWMAVQALRIHLEGGMAKMAKKKKTSSVVDVTPKHSLDMLEETKDVVDEDETKDGGQLHGV